MFGNTKRNGRGANGVTTLIAEGTAIRGDVEFNGALHLDGAIEGCVRALGSEAMFTLSDKGSVTGEIHAPNAMINGTVKGDVTVLQRLEMAGQARVEGNVYYSVLEMAAGAQITGKMIHQSEQPRQLSAPTSAELAKA